MSEAFKLTLTNSKLAELASGLNGLDGLRVKGELEPFLFNPETTWAIAENQTLVSDRLRSYEKARKALTAQHKISEGMTIDSKNSAQVAAFMTDLDVLQETEVVIDGLKKISREKLNVGHDKKKEQNTIPPSTLARLVSILED